MGPKFAPMFKKLLPDIVEHTKKAKDSHNRVSAMATMGDIFDALGSNLQPFLPVVFPLVLSAAADTDVPFRRNAFYALGTLCLRV